MGPAVGIAGAEDVVTLAGLRRAWNVENGSGEGDAFESRHRAWWHPESSTRTSSLIELDGRAVLLRAARVRARRRRGAGSSVPVRLRGPVDMADDVLDGGLLHRQIP